MTQIGLNLSKKFAKDSVDALADMEATGKGHALEDVQVYFARLKKYRQGQGGRPLALEPKVIR
jgi:hypothetical protein